MVVVVAMIRNSLSPKLVRFHSISDISIITTFMCSQSTKGKHLFGVSS